MPAFAALKALLPIAVLLMLSAGGLAAAGNESSSGFGEIAIPQPVPPATAENCVEPVDIMRREHMVFLDHQRDRTVIDGERGSKYSLSACLDCHNPTLTSGETPRYGEDRHFCSACHNYASVSIDCFECHADRGHGNPPQAGLGNDAFAATLSAATLRHRLEAGGVD